MLAISAGEEHDAAASDVDNGAISEPDSADDAPVQLGEVLTPPCHVIGGACVQVPPILMFLAGILGVEVHLGM